MTRREDQFTITGEVFTRTWSGDNSGHYDWTSADGRLVCWCSKREFATDQFGSKRAVHEYSATLDGYPSTKTWPTLAGAMTTAVQSRAMYDRRKAA